VEGDTPFRRDAEPVEPFRAVKLVRSGLRRGRLA
jgi:hypothetical protein